jgi:hypothetical protein
MQTLQHKLDSRQEQYNLAAAKLKALRKQLGYETDVSERFKLENEIKQVETELDQLAQEVNDLERKIQAIESGQIKLEDVLKQEGLRPSDKQTTQLRRQFVVALAAIAVVGLGGLAINGILVTGRSDPGTTSSVEPAASQPQAGLDSRFAGAWTTEFDVAATHSMELEVQTSENDKLKGTLTTRQRRGETSSGGLSVLGKGQEDTVDIILYNQGGAAIGNAELRLKGENLEWRLTAGSNEIFPSVVTLSRR